MHLLVMSGYRDAGTSRTAGTLRLRVRYDGKEPDDLGGFRSRYAYRVASTDPEQPQTYSGNDLFSGVGAEPATDQMVRTLAVFLGAAAERYGSGMRAPDQEYPAWLYEAAYLNADELALLQAEQTDLDQGVLSFGYGDIVFQQGDEALEALRILDARGEQAAVDHLKQAESNRGSDARPAGADYDELPAGPGDRVYINDAHVLTYNIQHGHIGLARRIHQYTQTRAGEPESGRGPYGREEDRWYEVEGPDRNGAWDGFQVSSDADPGL